MAQLGLHGSPRGYRFRCDACDKQRLDTGLDNYSMAVGAVKRQGWTLRRVGTAYAHVCPECTRLERKTPRERMLAMRAA